MVDRGREDNDYGGQAREDDDDADCDEHDEEDDGPDIGAREHAEHGRVGYEGELNALDLHFLDPDPELVRDVAEEREKDIKLKDKLNEDSEKDQNGRDESQRSGSKAGVKDIVDHRSDLLDNE